ncbi:MAG: hypothetical protein HY537_13505 [Deltaproteobacteria bacterium]|nr:hypothetical protein [Deltaproteobacteria bacterium]
MGPFRPVVYFRTGWQWDLSPPVVGVELSFGSAGVVFVGRPTAEGNVRSTADEDLTAKPNVFMSVAKRVRKVVASSNDCTEDEDGDAVHLKKA